VLRLLRPGGVAMLDNVLRGGEVLNPEPSDDRGRGTREVNERIATDERVDAAMLGIADGVTLVRKR